MASGTPVRVYVVAWFALAVIGIGNGVLRVFTYGRAMPELAAHQLSTVTAVVLTGAFVWWLQRRWPIRTSGGAWSIGIGWCVATVLFEFGFGHYVAGHPWGRLLADYNLFDGRVWSLFLVWLLVVPALARRYAGRGHAGGDGR